MAIDKKTAKSTLPSIILRLSRGRTLKVTFRPRIRLANILVKLLAAATGLFALSVAQVHAAPPVNALPTGGQVVYGNTSFQQTSNTLNVNQASQSTIINWQSFNIGAQSTVNFNQPNSSAVALNRILGDNASQIYGQLNANGNVFLLNPNGMLFAPGSQVNVGGLLASTMHISDSDFIAGNYRLTNAGAGAGAIAVSETGTTTTTTATATATATATGTGIIDNQGLIRAKKSIAFVGNHIRNSGNLYATNVSLVAGDIVALNISQNGLIRARIESPALQASISNSGNINAVKQVTMTAGQSRDTLNSLVNNSGTIRATGLSNQGGVITLQGGTTLNSGVLDASSATGKGGTVAVLGEHVGIVESGSVIASGATGGGTILVGGDFQGKNPNVFNADRTYVGANTTLNADAINTGKGGKVIVWADDITRAYGNISARGGSLAGNGGFVEVSGKHSLDYQAQTNTSAAHGQFGTLLLDPTNITVVALASPPHVLADVNAFANPNLDGLGTNIEASVINASASNVILQATSDITFNAAINITNPLIGLTATAGNIINVNQSITTNNGDVTLNAASDINVNANGAINLGTGNLALNSTSGNINIKDDITAGNIGASANAGNIVIGDFNAGILPTINASGNVTLRAQQAGFIGGNIDVYGSIHHQGSVLGAVLFNADRDITLQGGSNIITASSSALNVTLASDYDGDGNGSIALLNDTTAGGAGVDILSNGGSITLGGGVGGAGFASNSSSGAAIGIDNANLDARGSGVIGGNITLRGTAPSTDAPVGIYAIDSTIRTKGNGAISLTGNAPGTNGDGVNIQGTTIRAENGSIFIKGDATTGATNGVHGIVLDNSLANNTTTIENTGAGSITLIGTRAGTNSNVGGIEVLTGTVIRNTGTGNVSLTGISAGAGDANRGLFISGAGTEIVAKNGDISLGGDASAVTSSFNSDGIFINGGALIESGGAGNLLLSGKSATAGVAQAGIAIADTGTIISNTGSGSTTINGQGNGTGTNSFGVVLFAGATVESTGTGNMYITAKANNTTSVGLAVDGPSTISVGRDLSINAGNNSMTSDQIRFQSANGANIEGTTSAARLFLNPLNAAVGIAVGGDGTTLGAFNLCSCDLAAINNFSNVVIGRTGVPAHTGSFTVAAGGLDSFTSANNNTQISLQSNSALIDFLGATTFFGSLKVINNEGSVALSSLNAIDGAIAVRSNDNVTIKAGSAINANGNIDFIANFDRDDGTTGGGDFINLAGAGAITTSTGNAWHVYSHDLAGDNTGGLVADFTQYNSHFGDALLSTGNGFIYGDVIFAAEAAPPVITVNSSPDSILDPIDDVQNDAVQDVSGQELVLIPVKTALIAEDEYVIATKTVGKELSCK